MKHAVIELRPALVVEADDLTVEDAALDLQLGSDRLTEIGEPPVDVALPRDQFAVSM